MKGFLLLFFYLSFGYLSAQETATLFIEDGNDDAYQIYYMYFPATDSVGDMFVDQEYLSMGFDAWPIDPAYHTHHIGLRFVNVPILPGSTITSAYIQFTSFIANEKPDRIYIRGEKNPSPQSFTSEAFNITTRARTDTFVQWDLPEWQAFIPGPAQKTPNLKYVIQELIDQAEWTVNKPMAFEIYGVYTLLTDTTLPRQSCAWEYMGDMYAPVLTINYNEPASVDEQELAKGMNIFPNPILNTFTVSFTELQAGHYEICMYDLSGQQACTVHEGQLDHGDHEFRLSAGELNLQPGIYFVSLSGETGNMVRKIVVKD